MKHYFIAILLLLIAFVTNGQEKHSLSGTITDATDIDIALFTVTTTDVFYPKAHHGE